MFPRYCSLSSHSHITGDSARHLCSSRVNDCAPKKVAAEWARCPLACHTRRRYLCVRSDTTTDQWLCLIEASATRCNLSGGVRAEAAVGRAARSRSGAGSGCGSAGLGGTASPAGNGPPAKMIARQPQCHLLQCCASIAARAQDYTHLGGSRA